MRQFSWTVDSTWPLADSVVVATVVAPSGVTVYRMNWVMLLFCGSRV
jgi:hypothetical protein